MDVLSDALDNTNIEELDTSQLEEIDADLEDGIFNPNLPETMQFGKLIAHVTRSTTQVAGYLMTLDTAHKVAQRNGFEYEGKLHKIWGTAYPPHDVFNDYLAKIDKLDMKAAIAHGYGQDPPLLLIIIRATKVPWPHPPPVTITDAVEDDEAIKVKEWLVSLGADPSDLQWGYRMDHWNIYLKEPKLTPQRIDPNPPKPKHPWMRHILGDPPSIRSITPEQFKRCKWNEETMEIIDGSWNQEGEDDAKDDLKGGDSSGEDTERE